jgi:uncharacterized protein YukE
VDFVVWYGQILSVTSEIRLEVSGVSEMGPEFRVDLGQLQHAIGTVRHHSGLIETCMGLIALHFENVREYWTTLAEASFEEMQQWFNRVQTALHQLLEEALRRLQAAYDTYRAAESTNVRNLTSG